MASKENEIQEHYTKNLKATDYVDYLTKAFDDAPELIRFVLTFWHDVLKSGRFGGSSVLEIGSGALVHNIASASAFYSNIVMSDYVEDNCNELKMWLKEKSPINQFLDVPAELEAQGSKELASTNCSLEMYAKVPSFATLKNTLYRSRSMLMPPLQRSMEELKIQDTWAETKCGKGFLLVDEGCGPRRILVQALGLTSLYQNDENVRKWVRRIAALPLVPHSDLDDAFHILHEDAPEIAEKTTFHDYVVETFMDDDDAFFHRSLWNHFDANNDRTTNAVEGWHRKINKRAGATHRNIYRLIRLLKQEQSENEVKM